MRKRHGMATRCLAAVGLETSFDEAAALTELVEVENLQERG